MKTRTKLLTLGAAAVIAAGLGTYAFTASAAGGFGGPQFMHGMTGGGWGPGAHGGHGMGGHHGMMGGGHGMMGGHGLQGAAFDPSSHLDALKTELAITPAQETAWTEYRTTLEETATAMHAAVGERTGEDPHAFMAEMHERQKSFETVKAAADKLLASLDETQKTKAEEILPGLASHHGPGPGMGGGPWMHHGHGG